MFFLFTIFFVFVSLLFPPPSLAYLFAAGGTTGGAGGAGGAGGGGGGGVSARGMAAIVSLKNETPVVSGVGVLAL